MAASLRLIAVCVGLLLAVSACSDPNAELDAAAEEAATSSTSSTTTAVESTTTTEASTTTLSELQIAEAEISRVVTDFHQFPIDSRKGEDGMGLEQTTGLLNRRQRDSLDRLEAEGQILLDLDPSPIEITDVTVDLDEGTAVVNACVGSASELLDAETLEVIVKGDPTDNVKVLYQLQFVDGVWKVSDLLPPGEELDCEIDG